MPGFTVHVVNTTAVKQYDGLKHSGDFSDARHLAHLLRRGFFRKVTFIRVRSGQSRQTERAVARSCVALTAPKRWNEGAHSLSDRGVPMATLDDEVRDLEAVVDTAGLDRFALLGRSQGGAISIRYAARHPDRVSRLVIIGGFARGALCRGAKSPSMENINAFCRVLEDGWGDENSALRQIWTSYAFPSASKEHQDAYNHMQRVACSPQDAARIHRSVSELDASADLASVQCPTLVLHNPDDALIPFEEGRLIASGIGGARLETFASRNHQPLPGEPAFDHVMRLIDEFLHVDVIHPPLYAMADRTADRRTRA
jgi:pimeloyl-ACP methyl ester carboxylesterase